MNQSTIKTFFSLIHSAIHGDVLCNDGLISISDEELLSMAAIAIKHDLAHLFAVGLDKNKLLQRCQAISEKEIIKAIYRYEQLNYELGRICKALEEEKVDFLPLKGSVLRQWYPEPWMRTSCDIDILVKEDEVDNAAEYLVNRLGYVRNKKGAHDISLFSPNKNHIELHYDLVEDGWANDSSKILKAVWETSIIHRGKEYWREMPDEMFYFYHIAHMAKHFEQGGCGIRPFIDLWILDKIETADSNKRNELLEKGDLMKFAEVARQLSKVWFEDAEHTDITKQMEQYILRGGVYGTSENRIAVQQQKKGGRLKYALSKIFIPYDTIKFHYPILQKHRWLTPIMEVRRWFKLIFCGHAKRSIRELKQNNNMSNAEAENIQVFLKNIGL